MRLVALGLGLLLASASGWLTGCGNPDGPPRRTPTGSGGVKGCPDGTGGTNAGGQGGVAGSTADAAAGSAGVGGVDAGSAGAAGTSNSDASVPEGGVADGGDAEAGVAGNPGSGGAGGSGGTLGSGGTPSSGGCAGTGGGSGGFAGGGAPTFPLETCVITQHCSAGPFCEAFNKNGLTENCGTQPQPGSCPLADSVGACVEELGNRCSVRFFYSSYFTEEAASVGCANTAGSFQGSKECEVRHRCDARLVDGRCAEFNDAYAAGTVEAACGSATYDSNAECDLKNSVGGCLFLTEDHCATVWYYKSDFTESQAREACDDAGGHWR